MRNGCSCFLYQRLVNVTKAGETAPSVTPRTNRTAMNEEKVVAAAKHYSTFHLVSCELDKLLFGIEDTDHAYSSPNDPSLPLVSNYDLEWSTYTVQATNLARGRRLIKYMAGNSATSCPT